MIFFLKRPVTTHAWIGSEQESCMKQTHQIKTHTYNCVAKSRITNPSHAIHWRYLIDKSVIDILIK